MSSSTSSWWASITSDLWSTPPLQEVLLGKKVSSRQETIRQLWDRADALQRELQAATDKTEAAEEATRHAERRAAEAVAELHAVTRARLAHHEKLRDLEAELRDRDARIMLLEAIAATLTKK